MSAPRVLLLPRPPGGPAPLVVPTGPTQPGGRHSVSEYHMANLRVRLVKALPQGRGGSYLPLSKCACLPIAHSHDSADMICPWDSHPECLYWEPSTPDIPVKVPTVPLCRPVGVVHLHCAAQLPPLPNVLGLKFPVTFDEPWYTAELGNIFLLLCGIFTAWVLRSGVVSRLYAPDISAPGI